MYTSSNGLYVAHGPNGPISITGKMANRHGLIAGATGTGKTVTLQVLAETFSQAGVPCFMADMKGDLSGISQTGRMSGFIEKRCAEFGISNPNFGPNPTRFYDVFGEQGHPMRTTISNMGPQLLSRLMGLNEVQSGVLDIIFKVADDKGLLLIDLKDLRSMLAYVDEHAAELRADYGNVTSMTIGAIQRALLGLENEGAEKFFAEPSFDIQDLFAVENGRGVMSVLAADKLMMNPKLYSTFLLWLMSDIYARLPEIGDPELPKLVFFFDEAHTLFTDTAPALVQKIEQVIRLIRSKGVGIYFVTQNPTDIPDSILGQLGNRIQHALRAYTPKDQKAVRSAAETFRPNPAFKTAEAISTLETGEALVSFLDEKGAPSVVERARILFPLSQIGAITEGQRLDIRNASPVRGKYDTVIDRESAFEILLADRKRAEEIQTQQQEAIERQKAEAEEARRQRELAKEQQALEKQRAAAEKQQSKGKKAAKAGLGTVVMGAAIGAAVSSLSRSAGNAAADAITGKNKKDGTKKKTGKSAGEKAVSSAASSALRTLTRSILGSLIK